MADRLFIFGLGYSAGRLADRLRGEGWAVEATGSAGTVGFGDEAAVRAAIGRASHILSSVPPDAASGGDPGLVRYGADIAAAPAGWIGYLSSTGVYGDTGGAWVDESAPVGTGRRQARAEADLAWQALRGDVRVFRLPGIYGPGRSALDRLKAGRARRVDLPGQVFSRIHVDDIVSGVVAGFDGPPGVYNLSDDLPCHQNRVIEAAAELLKIAPPPVRSMDDAALSEQARGFYAENRRVASGRARRLLGWRPAYPDYRAGLRACMAALSGDPAGARSGD
ncbi:MAG: SDR family NAD(P)-dependent oxidoreductase [Sphingobium sp.]